MSLVVNLPAALNLLKSHGFPNVDGKALQEKQQAL
jgi:hypothetical protein